MKLTLADFARDKLAELEARSQRRWLEETDRIASVRVRRGGREMVSFCCNDYLNLSMHPRVKQAAKDAIDRFGAGAGASRLITGDHPLLRELEGALAQLKGAEDAVVFGSGYLANIGIIPAFMGPDDLVVADELSHACLNAGAQLSGAKVIRFAHNDMDDLRRHLGREREAHGHCLVITDGVFSMDGDLAPLPELSKVAEESGAWLLTDDAHGVGVLGLGRGSSFAFSPRPTIPLQMGTLSKALGSYGGYLCADRAVCEFVRNRARSFVYSTGLPPASAAAALEALKIVGEDPARCALPVEKARAFCADLGLPTPESPIVPLMLGLEKTALAASAQLEAEGFLVTAIRPPTVPAGTARLRLTFTAEHDDGDISRLTHTIRKLITRDAAE